MTGSDSLAAHRAWTRSLLTAVLTLLLCGVLAGAAQAVPLTPTDAALPGSDFQGGDGDQDAESGLRDWQSLVGSPGLVAVNDPNALDTTFGTGSHENDPEHWDLLLDPDGVTPAKANFFNAWFYVDEREDTFLYLAFNREESGGNVFLAFELNQDTRLWTNASGDQIQCRTTGDLIISYEIQNDDNIDVIIQEWVSDSEVTAADVAAGYTNGLGCSKTGHFVNHDLSPAVVQGAINAGRTITNYLPGAPATLGEELFGEAAINLTAVFEDVLGNPCFSFGQVSLHGRSSESDSAAMQDLVGPVPLLVRNCTASGTKYHDLNANGDQDAGEPGLAGFRIWADYDNDGVLDANEPFDDTDASGAYTINNINPPDGDYSLREKLTSGAGTDGWICSEPTTTIANGPFPCAYVDIDAGDNPNVVGKDFGNYKKATVIVEKQTVPDGAAASFAFTSTIPGKANFSLTDGQSNSTEVDPGVYTATENTPAGWSLTDITCSGDTIPPNSSDAGGTATFNAQSGETITCVFTNTQDAKVTIVKDAVPNDAQDFGFTGSFGPFSLDDDADATLDNETTFTVSGSDFGEKTITESVVADWALTGLECSEGTESVATRTATLQVDPGDDITCTFTNKKAATVTIVKDAVPNDAQDFAFTTTGAGLSGFSLDDDGDPTLDDEKTFVIEGSDFGEKTITESPVAGWSLTDITCSEGSDAGATATIQVDPGDQITCTFTNKKDAKVTIVKDAVPNDAQDFGFTGSFGSFSLDDDADPTLDNETTFTVSGDEFGQKTVTESAVAGWSLTGLECSEGTESVATRTATLQVDPGDDITCTFTNKKAATVTIVKDAVPNDAQDFAFTTTGAGLSGFSLDDDGDPTLDDEKTFVIEGSDFGEKTVTESAVAGWDLTGLECSEGTESVATRTATLQVDPGDSITCTFTNTKRGSVAVRKTEAGSAELDLAWKFQLTGNGVDITKSTADGNPIEFGNLVPGTYTLCEVDMPIAWHSSLEEAPFNGTRTEDAAAGTAKVCIVVEISAGEDASFDVDNTTPSTLVIKEGTTVAHHGDVVTYTFDVSNSGNVPLQNIVVSDDKCPNVTRDAAHDTNADGDALLENPGVNGTSSEVWRFTCSYTLGEHSAGEANPIVNTATATGEDIHGNPVSDTDTHETRIIHPAIDIAKTGPARATVGAALNYTLTVTNPGDVAFAAQDVVVTDPKCQAPPAGPNTGSDATPGTLDPGDTWTYTCTAQTAGLPPGPFVNTANVSGKDFLGKTVTDTADFTTVLEAGAVLPAVPGSARLRGPSGCVKGPFTATVRGSRIARVTFFLDGKRFKRITAPNGEGSRFTVSINPRGRGFGVHRVTVRVEFSAASETRARTLRLSFQRCRKQVVKPRFTG